MSFDAANFLAGLFEGNATPNDVIPVNEKAGFPVNENAPAIEETTGSPTALADAPESAPVLSGEPDADAAPFPGWVLRPDVDGRLGWEAPDLPECRRWWARARFEDLPTLAAYFSPSARRPGIDPCPWCGRRDWWRSRAWSNVVRCGWCSPPAPWLAVEWLNRSESTPAEKAIAGS